jgi:hypothetical protein
MTRKTNSHYIQEKLEPHIKLTTFEYGCDNDVVTTNLCNKRISKCLRKICIEISRRVNQIYHYKHLTVMKGLEVNKENFHVPESNQ